MSRSADELAQIERFGQSYVRGTTDVMHRVERLVCGCEYGGTSWATRQEADDIGHMLGLRPGDRLLEVGAGSGWPALYLADKAGCDVVLTDLPLEGLVIAAERAASDRIAGVCWPAVADGAALPFADESFDAVTYSDVLCCLEPKQAVLESCRRVIRRHGQMIFSVIFIAGGLSDAALEHAVTYAPPFAETATSYPAMLAATGWRITGQIDLADEYLATAERFLVADETHADDLRDLLGETDRTDRLNKTRNLIGLIGDGKLRRELFRVVPA